MRAEPKELTYNEVPQALLEEISREWGEVAFDLESDVTPSTRTFKTQTQFKGETIENGVAMDPETFAPIAIRGHVVTTYYVRFDEETNVVRKIIEHQHVVADEVLGPVEFKQDSAALGTDQ